jgi:hypothetical protein
MADTATDSFLARNLHVNFMRLRSLIPSSQIAALWRCYTPRCREDDVFSFIAAIKRRTHAPLITYAGSRTQTQKAIYKFHDNDNVININRHWFNISSWLHASPSSSSSVPLLINSKACFERGLKEHLYGPGALRWRVRDVCIILEYSTLTWISPFRTHGHEDLAPVSRFWGQ